MWRRGPGCHIPPPPPPSTGKPWPVLERGWALTATHSALAVV